MSTTGNPERETISHADFTGRNLCGRSFRGQDLRGANFKDCNLRGVDFREANLEGADFRGARMGKGWRRLAFGLLVGALVGLSVGVLQTWALMFIDQTSKRAATEALSGSAIKMGMTSYLLLLQFLVTAALRQSNKLVLAFIGAVAAALFVVMVLNVDTNSKWAVEGAVPISLAVAGALAFAFAWALFATVVLALFGIKAVCVAVIAAAGIAAANEATAVAMAVPLVLVGGWLNFDAVRREAPSLAWLRHLSLAWNAIGTDFRLATLTGAAFEGADVRHARLAGSSLGQTSWRDVRNLHLANTLGTVLEPKIVRDTVVGGDGKGQSFIRLDLRGVDFSGMPLDGADFSDADLSGASFTGAGLPGAKLIRAVLLGADLSKAKLTGAAIAHWNIDKHTRFTDIDCDYVYLDEAGKDRQPESGKFRPGDFEKLYQEIAHTVDFLIENTAQMEALQRGLAKVRADFGDDAAQFQKVERKEDVLKVSVEVPPEREEFLRKEIRREYECQLLEQQHENALLKKDLERAQSERDLAREGKEEIKALIGTFVPVLERPHETTVNVRATAMNEDSRKVENSPISNSAVNLGDHVTQSNQVSQAVRPEDLELHLKSLRGVIDSAPEMPEALKANAHQQIEALRTAAALPPAEAKTAALAPLEALKTAGTVAGGLGSLIGAVAKLFGI